MAPRFTATWARPCLSRPQYAYLRNGWDLLDCLVVVTSVLALALSGSQASAAKGVRLLRALRPLRLIRRCVLGCKWVRGRATMGACARPAQGGMRTSC